MHALLLSILAATALQAAGSSQLLSPNPAYSGIGQLPLSSTCTAFFIQTPGNGPAYALTAGHCYSLNAQEVFLDIALSSIRSVTFNYFADSRTERIPVPIRRIAYSTMKGWDIMLLELNTTRAELASRIAPLALEPADPPAGEPISVYGIPASFFDPNGRYLRRSRCSLGGRADLLEFTWHFYNVRRNDCEDIVGGISGSPVLSERTGRVIGIVNTTTHLAWNSGGDFDCYAGRPCEIANRAQRVEEETSYSVPVAGLLQCFTPSGQFSVAGEGCPLDPGRPSLSVTRRQRNQQPGATWAATVATTAPSYRYKAIAAGIGDCREEAGYSPPIPAARNIVDDAIPREENRYLLCVVPEGASVRNPTVLIARIDATPPILPPFYTVIENDSLYRIPFTFIPPELSSYSYKFGPLDTTACDTEGYRPYLRIPISIPIDGGPYRFCFHTHDEADNRSHPYGFTLGAGPVIFPHGIGHPAGFRPDSFAPGQWISLYGLQLEDAAFTLRDAAGTRHPLTIGYRSRTQINARIPQSAATGPAQIGLEPIVIDTISPGILLATHTAGNEILAYTTGLAAATTTLLQARLGRTPLTVQSIETLPETGIELIRLQLPESHALQGLQYLQLLTATQSSNRAAIQLPSPPE